VKPHFYTILPLKNEVALPNEQLNVELLRTVLGDISPNSPSVPAHCKIHHMYPHSGTMYITRYIMGTEQAKYR